MHYWTHFITGASWAGQRTKMHQDEAINNQAVMQSHFAGVKTSITKNQDPWADHMRKWIPEEYQTAAQRWATVKQIPTGGQAKHLESTLKQSLKQCNKAADSWATTGWKPRLAATEAGGGGARFTNSYISIPGAATLRWSSRRFLQAKGDCQGLGAGADAPAHKDLLLWENQDHQHCQNRGTS